MNIRLYIIFFFFFSCQSNSDKIIADQKAKIDSLQLELNDYKILHSIAKEIIDKDTSFSR
jgi:hypothetical protein